MSFSTRLAALAATFMAIPTVAVAKPFQAQPVNPLPILPRAISVDPVIPRPVNPVQQVQVWLNRGGTNPIYRPGEAISIAVQPSRDAYIYLYSVEANGEVKLIVPNSYAQAATFVRAGQVFTFPPAGAPFRLTVTPPYGQASVFALASPRPLNRTEVSYLERPGQVVRLARGKRRERWQDPSESLIQVQPYGFNGPVVQRIQVDPVPQPELWLTGTAFYQVSF